MPAFPALYERIDMFPGRPLSKESERRLAIVHATISCCVQDRKMAICQASFSAPPNLLQRFALSSSYTNLIVMAVPTAAATILPEAPSRLTTPRAEPKAIDPANSGSLLSGLRAVSTRTPPTPGRSFLPPCRGSEQPQKANYSVHCPGTTSILCSGYKTQALRITNQPFPLIRRENAARRRRDPV